MDNYGLSTNEVSFKQERRSIDHGLIKNIMSKTFTALAELDRQRHGKYTALVNGYKADGYKADGYKADGDKADGDRADGDKARETANGSSFYLYIMVATVAAASLAVLTLTWKNYAYQRRKDTAFRDMTRAVSRQDEKIAALNGSLDLLRSRQTQKVTAVEKEMRAIDQKAARASRELDELIVDTRMARLRIEDLEQTGQALLDKVIDLNDEMGLLKNLQGKVE